MKLKYIKTTKVVSIPRTITTMSVNCVSKSHYVCSDLEYLQGGLTKLKHLNLGNTENNTCLGI